MIANMLSVGNGKGGVFKSSIVANVAGTASSSGWRVLVIDTDPQGHAGLDLGVESSDNDHGEGLYRAMSEGGPLHIVENVRPSLDLVPGGEAATRIVGSLQTRMASGDVDEALRSFEKAIAPYASQYNLILVDTPPGEKVLLKSVFTASHFVVIPTKVDRGSRDGIDRVCRDVLSVLPFNPDLQLLGVIPVGLPRRAERMKREVRERLSTELAGLDVPVLESIIHDVGKAAVDCREEGLLAVEYEAGAKLTEEISVAERIAARKAGEGREFSSGASGLAEDYQILTDELLTLFSNRLSSQD